MASQQFVDSLLKEIVQPGVQRLMETRYFSELREGKLSKKRLQGFALQHYLHQPLNFGGRSEAKATRRR